MEIQTGLRPQLAQNRSMANGIGSRETLPLAFPTLTEAQIDQNSPLGTRTPGGEERHLV